MYAQYVDSLAKQILSLFPSFFRVESSSIAVNTSGLRTLVRTRDTILLSLNIADERFTKLRTSFSLASDSRNYAILSLYFAGERPKNHATHTHNVGRGRQERTARAVCVQPMPKKKDWGEATRRSDRLTTSIEPAEPTQSEEPAEPAERITETEADQNDHAMESSDKMCCRVSHPSKSTTSSLSWPKARRKVAKRHGKSPQPRALSGEAISRRRASPPTELYPYGADQHAPNSGYNAKAKRT